MVLKGCETGYDFVPARASYDLKESFPFDKIEQRGDDFDVIQRAEVAAGGGIDVDYLRSAGQSNRDLIQNRVLNLATSTPGHAELHEDRLLRV